MNNYAIVLSIARNTTLPWRILLLVYMQHKRLVFPPLDRRHPYTPTDRIMDKNLRIANRLHKWTSPCWKNLKEVCILTCSAPTSNQKLRDMYPNLTYDKLSPLRKLIASKEVVTHDLPLEIDNQPNSTSNTFMKTDTFMKSNHLFQRTSSRISSRFHTFISLRILILSSCVLSSPSWDLFRSECSTKSLCAFLIFSMRATDPAALILHDFISVTKLHK
jgi:hypothetical protein